MGGTVVERSRPVVCPEVVSTAAGVCYHRATAAERELGAVSTALLWIRETPLRRCLTPLFLVVVLVALVGFPAPVAAVPPAGTADVIFQPASVATAVGGLFTVEVVVEATTEVEGVQVVIAYDPAHLEFVSAQPTGPLPHHLSSEHDAAAGRLFYAVGAESGRFPNGIFSLVRLAFRLKAAPAGPLSVSIPRESRHRTIIAAGGTNVLHEARSLTVTVDPTQCRGLPVEGTASLFERFYTEHDSLRLLGRPLGAAGVLNGVPFQLFEKGRLEDHSANATLPPAWRFQYGLLVDELIQAGVKLPIGGDASTLTYADLRARAAPEERIAPPAGFTGLTAVLPDGSVFVPFTADLSLAPGHVVTSRFWAYINRHDLFPDGWLHDVGLPITEPLEALVDKGPAKGRRIIIQAFQRTILTDDLLNPPQWRIERANVGSDYACAFPERRGG